MGPRAASDAAGSVHKRRARRATTKPRASTTNRFCNAPAWPQTIPRLRKDEDPGSDVIGWSYGRSAILDAVGVAPGREINRWLWRSVDATMRTPDGYGVRPGVCGVQYPFCLLSQGAQVACFAAVARHLVPGGRFVVEAFVPDPTRFERGGRVGVTSVGLTGCSSSARSMISWASG
jgi:hypothetical protein